jgi:integrase
MATFEKRTTRDSMTVWRVKVRRKGAPPQTATFSQLSEAKKWAQITEGAVLEGRHFITSEAKRHTLADVIDRYMQDVLPHTRPSTAYTQAQQLQWWKVRLGHYQLADITSARIVECCDRLARGHSNATVVRYLAVLSHVCTVAIQDWDWLEQNPVHKVRKPKEPCGRDRFLSDEERQRLLDTCKVSSNPYIYIVVVLALSTGARQDELLGLTWHDIDLHRGTLTFRETKNGECRTVPLTGLALDLMRQHARVRRLGSTLVFPRHDGMKPLRIRWAWDRAVKHADIPDFRFHDLRHSAASYLAMNGASLMEIAEILGHKTLSMVKRYAHLSEQHTRSVVERMNRAVFG